MIHTTHQTSTLHLHVPHMKPPMKQLSPVSTYNSVESVDLWYLPQTDWFKMV